MIGRSILHYVIEARLGEGGMGAVYRARDTRLGRKVAIKVLSPALAGDPAMAGRLLREARAASRLNHPHIVTVYEVGEAEGLDFIVMEHVEGRTLAREIPAGGLPVARALELAGQIAGAVAAAHQAGVVHRDLKPANVIVMPDGRAKVLDFGLARSVPAPGAAEDAPTRAAETLGLTTPGMVVGTVGYMAPEQIEGRPCDARTDVFSLGVILFEMLTGRRPFTGESEWAVMAATVHGAAPAVGALRPGVPAELSRIVARCLARRPEERYASAVELAQDLARSGAPVGRARVPRAAVALGVALALLAVGVVAWSLWRESRLRWARETAVAEIGRLTARDDLVGAWQVARRALAIAPREATVRQVFTNLTHLATFTSEPPGADVAIHSFLVKAGPWVPVGRTPIQNLELPMGLLRLRVTRVGYDTLEVGQGSVDLDLRLVPAGSAKPGMVLVPHGSFQLESTGEGVTLPDFWLDRYEVTNRQFKAFVDAGGYRRRELWREPFVRDGHPVTWEQAMASFRDATGRPGPAAWELGTYPEGQADFPVGGVSWYEAAAYAAWAGKRLPTAYHWYLASGAFGIFSDIITASNFSGKGPVPVGSTGGLGPYGTYDMAGNVKEWCWNGATGGRRYILGGAWDEPPYMFRDADAQLPFERRPTFGFRCMAQQEPVAPRVAADIRTFERDPATLIPVGDELFRAYRHLYDYDVTPLDARIESVDDANPAWRRERVTVRTAYGDERLPIILFIPKTGTPPFQAVVNFPGADALGNPSSQNLRLQFAECFPRSGRVLVWPVYKGTYERRTGQDEGTNQMRDVMIQRGKDLRRAVDYLDTRRDIDSTRIAFYGVSLGAYFGPLFLAIEPRLRAGVFFSGGFETGAMPPEADPVNFAPRVKVPVLMVNGREDFALPYATSQVPMFRALGTPEAEKLHVVLEGGHIPSHLQESIKVVLDWLDQRFGPVR